jgi:hypothetical protein
MFDTNVKVAGQARRAVSCQSRRCHRHERINVCQSMASA